MAVLKLLTFPDPRLRTIAKPVQKITAATQKIIDDMFESMAYYGGIGLAATQVGIDQRIIVVDLSEQGHHRQCFINLEITIEDQKLVTHKEGCLSVPGFYEDVDRPEKIKYRALDRHGNIIQTNKNDDPFLACCLQHELDHLNGKLFVDYLSSLKRDRIRHKLIKRARVEKHA